MRVIYSTPRLENAERLAALLEAEGVAVRVLFGPHFRRNTWRGANYRQSSDAGQWPRVMVLNNGDLPKARALLRETGVLAPPAFERSGGAGAAARLPPVSTDVRSPAQRTGRRIRVILIMVAVLVAAAQAVRLLL